MPTLNELMKDLNKQYGETLFSQGNLMVITDRIPLSSPRLNYMTYGGIPRGRLIEFAGEEGGGKTTTALDVVANAQQLFQQEYEEQMSRYYGMEGKLNKTQLAEFEKLKSSGPKRVLYIDAENTIDEEWARTLGVQTDSVVFYKPQQQSAEEIFEDTIQAVCTGEVGLIVLDSLGCLVSSQAWEKTVEERTYGGIAMALTLFSKKLSPLCAKYKCTFIGINQVRADMNSRFGGLNTPGGKGWKHMCSVRFMFRKGELVDEIGDRVKNSSESPYGNKVMIDLLKTKCFRPDRRIGYYVLTYTDGIDVTQDIFELGIAHGMINKTGGWYTFTNPNTKELFCEEDGSLIKLNGKAAVLQFLNNDIKVRAVIEERILEITEDKGEVPSDLVLLDTGDEGQDDPE